VARRFDYQPALTGKIVGLKHIALYQPFAIWDWSNRWSRQYPKAFAIPKLVGGGSILAALGLSLLAFRRRPPRLAPFGQSAWGDAEDARANGLFASSGVVIGKLGQEILCHDGPAHVLIAGGTRSGKTRGAVIPTLLAWPQSAVVLDVKDELFEGDGRHDFPGIAAFRQELGPVLRLAFTARDSICFNVLDCVRKGPHEVRDVQNIVEIIADPYGDGRHGDFWDRSAKRLLTGLILHVLYAEEDKNLKRVFELLADLDETAKRMENTFHLKDPESGRLMVHPAVLSGAVSYRKCHEKIRMGIKATAESYLTLFDDPLVQARTARSDFSIDDLMCAERPVTLFLAWPPAESIRLKPLIRLTMAAILHGLMEHQQAGQRGRPKKHDLLFVMDEFPQLGRIDFFEKSLGAMAGYGLRTFLVTQSLNYVNQAYGAKNTILDNCAILAVLGVNDAQTAETVSRLAGETYEMRPQETWVSKSLGLGPEQRSISFREEKRALILPGDVRALPKEEQLIFVEGARPLKAQKLKYDREPIFKSRVVRGEVKQASLDPVTDWEGLRGFGLKPPPLAARKAPGAHAGGASDQMGSETGDLFAVAGSSRRRAQEVDDCAEIGLTIAGAIGEEQLDASGSEGLGVGSGADVDGFAAPDTDHFRVPNESLVFPVDAPRAPVRTSRFDLRGRLTLGRASNATSSIKQEDQ